MPRKKKAELVKQSDQQTGMSVADAEWAWKTYGLPMLAEMPFEGWDIVFKTEIDPETVTTENCIGYCRVDSSYMSATICIAPGEHDSMKHLCNTIRHELMHLLQHPIKILADKAEELLRASGASKLIPVLMSDYQIACEHQIFMLERWMNRIEMDLSEREPSREILDSLGRFSKPRRVFEEPAQPAIQPESRVT
jgi:hypothetical protein